MLDTPKKLESRAAELPHHPLAEQEHEPLDSLRSHYWCATQIRVKTALGFCNENKPYKGLNIGGDYFGVADNIISTFLTSKGKNKSGLAATTLGIAPSICAFLPASSMNVSKT